VDPRWIVLDPRWIVLDPRWIVLDPRWIAMDPCWIAPGWYFDVHAYLYGAGRHLDWS
jgi:hypothetical protein